MKTRPTGLKVYTNAEVREILLGISRTTLWEWVRKGHFPPPVLIGPGPNGRRGWPSPVVERWLMGRPDIGGVSTTNTTEAGA